jgi:hypothetical protein
MDLREIAWGDVDWILLRDQWRVVKYTVMSLRVPYNISDS